ncbi:hypothetical protein [Streptomyces bikiniensis]|uniref:hypothetical protein n=1 Tax=Streptomyces bikiniensis TaxID=1896 RepID=UPI001F1A89F3|nr:hypothetical protein [Streptomyces bikiniensis]
MRPDTSHSTRNRLVGEELRRYEEEHGAFTDEELAAAQTRVSGTADEPDPSRGKVEAVTEQTVRAATGLLEEAGLHGHKHAIDATVAELALRRPGPVAVLTSDVDDMAKLRGNRVRLIAI